MNRLKLPMMMLALCLAACNSNNTPTPAPTEDTEYITWKRNGVTYSSTPASILKVYDVAGNNKKYVFQEKAHVLNCDNYIIGSDFNTNITYNSNSPNVQLTYQLGYAGNSKVDTTFHYVTFKITQNDASWFVGEFSASDCKATDASGVESDIPVVITEGKFKLKK